MQVIALNQWQLEVQTFVVGTDSELFDFPFSAVQFFCCFQASRTCLHEGWYGKSFGKSRWGPRSNGLPHLCLARTEGCPFVSHYPVALINKTHGLCFLSHFFW